MTQEIDLGIVQAKLGNFPPFVNVKKFQNFWFFGPKRGKIRSCLTWLGIVHEELGNFLTSFGLKDIKIKG